MNNKILNIAGVIWATLGGAMAAMGGLVSISIGFCIFGVLFVILYARNIFGGLNNIITVFMLFFSLYGFAGPLGVIGKNDAHTVLGVPPASDLFLLLQTVALMGFTIGMCGTSVGLNLRKPVLPPGVLSELRSISIKNIAVLLLAIASIMEIVNYNRIGGFQMLVQGKAEFQSYYGALALTLPAHAVADIAFAFLGLGFAAGDVVGVRRVRTYLATIVASAPLLFTTLVLGQRGALLSWVMVFLMGYFMFEKVSKIKLGYIAIIFIVYIFLSAIFSVRATLPYALKTGDFSVVYERSLQGDRLAQSVDPSSNEFGAAFGNFSVYEYWSSLGSLRLGETYLTGLVVPVPSFIYPGEKPKQITYEFRDSYLQSHTGTSRISGTGFSSILEAYMNWGIFGVGLVYMVVGFVLVRIERFRYNKMSNKSVWGLTLYLLMVPLAQVFHRSAFGATWGSIVVASGLLGALWLSFQLLRGGRDRLEDHNLSYRYKM